MPRLSSDSRAGIAHLAAPPRGVVAPSAAGGDAERGPHRPGAHAPDEAIAFAHAYARRAVREQPRVGGERSARGSRFLQTPGAAATAELSLDRLLRQPRPRQPDRRTG